MKRIGQFILMVVAVILLVACGGLPTEAPEGLTSAMVSNPAKANEQEASMELKAAQCQGTLDTTTNFLQVSFQLTADVKDFGSAREPILMFGGGTGLLARLGKTEPGAYAVSCDGEAEVAAMSLLANGQAVSWITGLKVPQLLLTAPSGEKTALKDVFLHGLTAKSDKEIPGILQAVYGVRMEDYQSFFAKQKLLVEDYPSTAVFEELALKNGLSKENVARFVAMSGEKDVAKQRALLLDVVTSENPAYIENVVGTTIKSLLAVGATPNEISDLFMEETKGRITVKFSAETVASPANLTVMLVDQNGGNVTVAADEPRNAADDGESDGGDPPPPPADGGDPPPTDGGDPPPDDGGNGKRPLGEFIRDLFWNMFHGAAAGATVGATAGGTVGAVIGTVVGPEGTVAGAAIGGVIGGYVGMGAGAVAGAGFTAAGGFHIPIDPDTGEPLDTGCNQLWVNC